MVFDVIFFNYFQLPAAVGEAPTFGFAEDMANKFFNPDGVRTVNASCKHLTLILLKKFN